jgi:SnoaL-like domain
VRQEGASGLTQLVARFADGEIERPVRQGDLRGGRRAPARRRRADQDRDGVLAETAPENIETARPPTRLWRAETSMRSSRPTPLTLNCCRDPRQGPQDRPRRAGKYFRTVSKNFDRLRVELEELLAAGDRVVVLGTVRGQASRTAFGTPPSDRRLFEIPFAHVPDMRERRVVRLGSIDSVPLLAPEPKCKPAPKPRPRGSRTPSRRRATRGGLEDEHRSDELRVTPSRSRSQGAPSWPGLSRIFPRVICAPCLR